MKDANGNKFVQLYLENWQITMVKDKLNAACSYIEINEAEVTPHPSTRYMVRLPSDNTAKNMYLTEWQKKELKNELGANCDFIPLTKELVPVMKYMAPPS
jgi:hypothetical protein